MSHCEAIASTGKETLCKQLGGKITRLRSGKKELEAEVCQLTAERDRLKSALTRLRHSWPTEDQTAWAYAVEVSDIAEEALQEAK